MESLLDKIRIKRDNKLVNAYQSKLQPAAQKLLFYLFSFSKDELFEINENTKGGYESKGITLPVKDFLGAYPGGKDLKVVDGACSLLASSQINITKEDEKSYVPLFEKITLSKTKITFEFNSRLAEYIVAEGSNNFTSYDYKHIRKLKSGNSVRLYDILINGSRKYPNNIIQLGELKQRMGLSSTKAYQKFSLFKQKVLTPCINDINKNSDLQLNMENIKTGRAVTAVNFIFERNSEEVVVEVESKEPLNITEGVQTDENKTPKRKRTKEFVPINLPCPQYGNDKQLFTKLSNKLAKKLNNFGEYDFKTKKYGEWHQVYVDELNKQLNAFFNDMKALGIGNKMIDLALNDFVSTLENDQILRPLKKEIRDLKNANKNNEMFPNRNSFSKMIKEWGE